jgi:hypothetical protein
MSIKLTTDSTTVIGSNEIGLEIPIKGRAKFVSAPINMTEARLSPTEYTRLSIIPASWILRILRMIMPGTKVRKTKPIVGHMTGISIPTLASPINANIASMIASEKAKHLSIFQLVGGFNCCVTPENIGSYLSEEIYAAATRYEIVS